MKYKLPKYKPTNYKKKPYHYKNKPSPFNRPLVKLETTRAVTKPISLSKFSKYPYTFQALKKDEPTGFVKKILENNEDLK